MKIIIITLSLLYGLLSILNAQNAGFSEGAVGAHGAYSQLSMQSLKDISATLGINNFSDDYFFYGGEIIGNLTPLVQLGFRYQTGCNSASAIVERIVDNKTYKLTRNLRHSITHYDLTASYKTSISGSLEYYIGGAVGIGTTGLLISQDSGDQSFAAMLDSYEPGSVSNSLNRSTDFSAWLAFAEAQNGVRLHIRKGMAVGFAVGYQVGYTFGRGEINYDFENIDNLPDLDFKAVKYSLGIYFGN